MPYPLTRYILCILSFTCLICQSSFGQAPPAATDTYSDAVYAPQAGTKVTVVGPNGISWPKAYTGNSGSSYSQNPPNGSADGAAGWGSVNCSGPIKATLTWRGTADNKPPKVIVEETVSVSWKGASGSGSHGLSATVSTVPYGDIYYGGIVARSLTVLDNPPDVITRTCSPHAEAQLPRDWVPPDESEAHRAAYASVTYTARVIVPYVSGTNSKMLNALPFSFYGTMTSFSITFAGESPVTGSGRGAFDLTQGFRYDSTHFSDLGKVILRVHAENSDGKSFDDEQWQIVYNEGAMQECAQFKYPSIITDVTGAMQAANYLMLSPAEYSRTAFLKHTRDATAFNFNAHGSSTGIGPVRDAPVDITYQNITDAVAKRAWRPPINIIFAASCLTGGLDSYLPESFGFSGTLVDRAYTGFNNEAVIHGIQSTAVVFWNELKTGTTVSTARNLADAHYQNNDMGEDQNHNPKRFPATLRIRGDQQATLKNLYGGTGATPWFVRY